MNNKIKKWKKVDKETYKKFIKTYPTELEGDFYMDWYSYNDFSNPETKWPESMVAKECHMYDSHEYYIWEGEYQECEPDPRLSVNLGVVKFSSIPFAWIEAKKGDTNEQM